VVGQPGRRPRPARSSALFRGRPDLGAEVPPEGGRRLRRAPPRGRHRGPLRSPRGAARRRLPRRL